MNADAKSHSNASARPWITYALLGACVISLSVTQHLENEIEAETQRGLQEAIDYYTERPYLNPPEILAARIPPSAVNTNRARYERDRQRRGMAPMPEGVMRRYQERLDELVIAGFQPLERMPQLRFGMRATEPVSSTVFSYPLLHANWFHLLGSIGMLLILGTFIERTWGHVMFCGVGLLTSVSAGLAFKSANPELADPLVGASGLVAGLLGAYLVRYASMWKDTTYVFVTVTGLCWLILPTWFGWEWSISRANGSSVHMAGMAGASWWAVAAGFGMGAVTALLISLSKIEQALIAPSRDSRQTRVSNPVLERALRAHAEGSLDRSHSLLKKLLESEPDNRDALLAMWDVGIDLGRPADAAEAMLEVIRAETRAGDAEAAVGHWNELADRGLEGDAEPALLIRMALLLRQDGQLVAAVGALRTALQVAEGPSIAVIAERIARETRDLDPQVAQSAAWRALGSTELDLAQRQSLETLLGELIAEERRAQAAAPPAQARAPQPKTVPEPSERAPEQWVDPELVDESGGPPTPESDPDARRLAPIDLEISSRELQVVLALPTELADTGLVIEAEGGAKKRIPYERVEAICVAAIEGLGPRPVIVIDLVLNWHSPTEGSLRVIRLRSDRFDPRRFSSAGQSALDSIRELIRTLLTRSGATPLPDLETATGFPFVSFANLVSYQRDILNVQAPPDEDPAPADGA
jgi:membrane associated rhomboid family serine protease